MPGSDALDPPVIPGRRTQYAVAHLSGSRNLGSTLLRDAQAVGAGSQWRQIHLMTLTNRRNPASASAQIPIRQAGRQHLHAELITECKE